MRSEAAAVRGQGRCTSQRVAGEGLPKTHLRAQHKAAIRNSNPPELLPKGGKHRARRAPKCGLFRVRAVAVAQYGVGERRRFGPEGRVA